MPCSLAAEAVTPVAPLKVDKARAELGKRLFYDYRLSGDTSLSCSSCHHPDKAFTDGLPLSAAYSGAAHFRNAPTLANTGYRKAWMHDGRLGTNLNDTAREMITETYLMNLDMRVMQERLKQDPVYVEMFKAAGMSEPSNGGARNALMDFMKTIRAQNAAYDTGTMFYAAGHVAPDGGSDHEFLGLVSFRNVSVRTQPCADRAGRNTHFLEQQGGAHG